MHKCTHKNALPFACHGGHSHKNCVSNSAVPSPRVSKKPKTCGAHGVHLEKKAVQFGAACMAPVHGDRRLSKEPPEPGELPTSARIRQYFTEFSTQKKGRLWTARRHDDPRHEIWSTQHSKRGLPSALKHRHEPVVPYTPPPPPRPIRKPSELKGRSKLNEPRYTAEELEALAEKLDAQADSLEMTKPAPVGRLGALRLTVGQALMAKVDAVKTVLKEWDTKGKGEFFKPEFRVNLRNLGVVMTSQQADELFDSWDEDKDSTLSTKEMKKALTAALEEAKAFTNTADPNAHRVAALRTRAQLARKAAEALIEAQQLEAVHIAFTEALKKRADLLLGDLLSKRRIKPGEMVALWSGSRGEHMGTLSKNDFKTFCLSLGLPEGTSVRDIHEVFDLYDADKGGYMSVDEAKAMIKGLQQTAEKAGGEGRQKKVVARSMRKKANKLAEQAMTEPSEEEEAAAAAEAAALAAAKRRRKSVENMKAGKPPTNAGHALSDERLKLIHDVKGTDTDALKEAAVKFSLRVQQQALAKGVSKWHAWWQQRLAALQNIKKAHHHMLQPTLGAALSFWADWRKRDTQKTRLVSTAWGNFRERGQQGAWKLWLAHLVLCKEAPAREACVKKGLAATTSLRHELRRRDLAEAVMRWNGFHALALRGKQHYDLLLPFDVPQRRKGAPPRRTDWFEWLEMCLTYNPNPNTEHPLIV